MLALLDMVNQSYRDHDEDRRLLEHTMEISSSEMMELNENLMQQSHRLRQAFEELESTKEQLLESKKILEISKELKAKNEELSAQGEKLTIAYQALKDAQMKLVHTEKMAVLGQLVAGIMHEINNPMGVIKGGTQNMKTSLNELSGLMEWSAEQGSEGAQNDLVLTLLRLLNQKDFSYISSREERTRRKELQSFFDECDIANAQYLARECVSIKLFKDDFVSILSEINQAKAFLPKALDSVFSFGKLFSDLKSMETAIAQMQKILFALKNYAYTQESSSPVKFKIIENLEIVLTLYHNKLKRGVEVIRNYEIDDVEVEGFPDEITQVWTNIVQNALQAMNYQGALLLNVRQEGDAIITSFTDTGMGISNEDQKKIFEPFFTTKKKGEGTGLGLSICKKIVEKHDGTLSAESHPGRTTFTIKLPLSFESKKLKQKGPVEAI